MKKARPASDSCWCDSGRTARDCCAPLLARQTTALTAEALMRSRYSAYAAKNEAYILDTWHPATRPSELHLDDKQRWSGLKVVDVKAGGVQDNTGQVEFVARYKIAGRGYRLHETSCFERIDGCWVYLDGHLPEESVKPC